MNSSKKQREQDWRRTEGEQEENRKRNEKDRDFETQMGERGQIRDRARREIHTTGKEKQERQTEIRHIKERAYRQGNGR